MNGTPALFRNSAVFLSQHPVVWLPVLAVQVTDFLIRFGLNAVRAPALLAVAPRSVLGGISGRANLAVVVVSTLLNWLPILSQVALLMYGMAVCARWSHTLRQDGPAPLRSWRVDAGPLARTAALTFFVITLTVGVGAYFTLRSGVPLRWAPLVSGCFLIMSSWFVVPSWLRLIAKEQGSRQRGWPPVPAFLAFVLGLVLAAAILFLFSDVLQQTLLRTGLKSHPVALLFWINLAGVCLASFPLAFSFVAMSRYAEDRPGWQLE